MGLHQLITKTKNVIRLKSRLSCLVTRSVCRETPKHLSNGSIGWNEWTTLSPTSSVPRSCICKRKRPGSTRGTDYDRVNWRREQPSSPVTVTDYQHLDSQRPTTVGLSLMTNVNKPATRSSMLAWERNAAPSTFSWEQAPAADIHTTIQDGRI